MSTSIHFLLVNWIAGQTIRSGQRIVIWLGLANHDEFAFEDPETFDILRNSNGEYSHVGFGYGAHYCIGAPLARLETRIVLEIVLQRLQNLQISEGDNSKKTEREK